MKWLLALVAVVSLTSSAHAEDRVKARKMFESGRQHFDLSEFKQALDDFKEAYRNYEEPSILFNIAQCHRQLGAKEEAVRFYRVYLAKLPNVANRVQVEDAIAKLERAITDERSARISQPHDTLAANPGNASVIVVAPTPPPPPSPVYKRWYFWTPIVVGVVGIGLGVGLGLGLKPSPQSAQTALGTFPF